MEALLSMLPQGSMKALEELNNAQTFSDLEAGFVLGVQQKEIKSELLLIRVLWKFYDNRVDLRELMLLKVINVLKEVIKSVSPKSSSYIVKEFVEILEKIAEGVERVAASESRVAECVKQNANERYEEMIRLYANSMHVIRVYRVGKMHPKVFSCKNDQYLELEDVDKLISIEECDEIIAGCIVLNSLCEKLREKNDAVLNGFVVNTLIYLLDVKATSVHMTALVQYMMSHSMIFKPNSRTKLLNSYHFFCSRVRVELDAGFIDKFMKPSEKAPRKNKEAKTQAENKEPAQNDIPHAVLSAENPKHSKQNRANPKNSNAPNPSNSVPKAPSVSDSNPELPKIEAGRIPETKEEVKQPRNQPPRNAAKKNYVPKQPSQDPPAKSIEVQVENLIDEAKYLFENNQLIDVKEYFEMFMSLQINDQGQKVFEKIDEMIAVGRPSRIKSEFWKIMMKVFDKLPCFDEHQISALRDKLRKNNGNVRDNKEKESRKRESKQEFKEELKRQGKYKEKFQNNDREARRAIKEPENPSLKSIDFKTLTESISKLSQDALDLIRLQAFDQARLSSIQQNVVNIKLNLQKHSKKCSLKFIGSVSTGTCLKDSAIDILVLDKSSEIDSIIQKAFPGCTTLNGNIYVLKTIEFEFKLYAECALSLEIVELFKKYCSIDSRVNEMIMFVKLWARLNKFWFISGFHLTIMTISFLQQTEPPVVLSLQSKDHPENIINGYDVWFDKDYSTPTFNYDSLGQLIYHFFNHFATFPNRVLDIKQSVPQTHSQKFIAIHPFTGAEIGHTLTESEIAMLESAIKASLALLINGQCLHDLLTLP